jgi:hypothetical protein
MDSFKRKAVIFCLWRVLRGVKLAFSLCVSGLFRVEFFCVVLDLQLSLLS